MDNTTEIIGCMQRYTFSRFKPVKLYDNKYLVTGDNVRYSLNSNTTIRYNPYGNSKTKGYRLLAIARLGDAKQLGQGLYHLLDRILFPADYTTSRFKKFETHHIDGDHDNNAIDNLVLLTKNDHDIAHLYLKEIHIAAMHLNMDKMHMIMTSYEDFINQCLSIDYILGNC